MEYTIDSAACPLCETPTSLTDLAEALWIPPAAATLLESRYPGWQMERGACPRCVHRTLLELLIRQGAISLQDKVELAGSTRPEIVLGVLPMPLRLHANPRYTGRGVTIAMVDAAFYPHPDLVRPHNRIRAWVDASIDPPQALYFGPDETPEWPGWDSGEPLQWHGMMTSTVAAGNGWQSHGIYRGLASEADLVLVQTRGGDGRIGNENIARALRWLLENGPERRGGPGVGIVSISVAGSRPDLFIGNPVDEAVDSLVREGITVVAAAGNEGVRRLVPPASAREALTIGGIDDKNNFDERETELWHSNYGGSAIGIPKPELVAPSIWVAAPVLPGSQVAVEAEELFARRASYSPELEARIAELKLVTPHYQHVDGTSFAAPIVASTVACMLQANPRLSTQKIREILTETAEPLEGVERERQGAGVLVPRRAIGQALRSKGGPMEGLPLSPVVTPEGVTFWLHEPYAQSVHILGSWNEWSPPGVEAEQVKPGVWRAHVGLLPPGSYSYRFVLDGALWIDDPDNPRRALNSFGGFDSLLDVVFPGEAEALPRIEIAIA
jgi:serine protease AprX